MKKLLIILGFLPFAGQAQCPQWINEPLKNTEAFMRLIEQRLSFKFTDSSINPEREKMIYNDRDGKYIIKLSAKQDSVISIYFEAPNNDMNQFTDWFEKEFLECAISKNEQSIVFPGCVVVTKPSGMLKKVFYMAAK